MAPSALGAVEGDEPLTGPGAPRHHGRPTQPRQVVRVHRLVQLEHHVVGRIDHVVDRADPHRRKPPREPVGRRRHAHPSENGAEEAGTTFRVLDRNPHPAGRRGRTGARGRRHRTARRAGERRKPELHAVRDRELPGNSLVAKEVGTVGRDVEDETGIRQRHGLEQRRARRGVGGKLPEALMVVAESQLARGAKHPLGDFTAQLALLDAKAAGQRGTYRREGIPPPRGDIGRAADDMAPGPRAVVHDADPEPIGIGMLHCRFDEADDDVPQLGMERLDGVSRRAEGAQPVRDFGGVERAAEELREPVDGDVHGRPPASCARKRMSPSYSMRISGTP